MQLSTAKEMFKVRQPEYYNALQFLGVLDQYIMNMLMYSFGSKPHLLISPNELDEFLNHDWRVAVGFSFVETAEGMDFWWDIESKCNQILGKQTKNVADYCKEIEDAGGLSGSLAVQWGERVAKRDISDNPSFMASAIEKYKEEYKIEKEIVEIFIETVLITSMFS